MLDILPSNNIPSEYSIETWYEISNNHISGIEPGEYFISTWGRIYDKYNQKFYPDLNSDYKWYKSVYFNLLSEDRIQVPIHRFMMYYFNPVDNWRELEVNYIDGVKYHNWIWNLEWTTHKENMFHARNTGLTKIGEDCGQAIMSNEDINYICLLISQGKSPAEIDQICKQTLSNKLIDYSAITDSIKNGYAWGHIANQYDFSNMYHRSYLLSEEQINEVCKVFEKFGKDIGYKQVLTLIGIDYSGFSKKQLNCYNACICALRNKKFFKNICEKYNY